MFISTKLQGGLGNQMFQYALVRNISLLRNVEYKVYGNRLGLARSPREFELYRFGIKLSEDNGEFKKVLTENSIEYEPALKEVALNLVDKNIEYDGYFQDVRYFEENKKQILKDFTWDKKLLSENTLLYESISVVPLNRKRETVAVHVRRTDYLNSDSVMVNLEVDYYNESMKMIKKQYPNAYFICFTDDVEWCKSNLNWIDEIAPYTLGTETMYLMSLCKHQIIANSTFSWWAAYLNKNKKKIVICPKKWFKSNDLNMCPDEWIKI